MGTRLGGIAPEAIYAGGVVSIEALHSLLKKIWREEKISDEWKKGLLVKFPKKEYITRAHRRIGEKSLFQALQAKF